MPRTLGRIEEQIADTGEGLPSHATSAPPLLTTANPAPTRPTGRLLSPSSVSLYLSCPQAWYLKYIERVPDMNVAPEPVEGTALHAVLAANNLHKIAEGDDLDPILLRSMWDDTWATKKKEITAWEDEKDEKIQERGRDFLTLYRARYAHNIDPISAEKHVEGEILGVGVHGYVDLVRKEDEGKTSRIVDYKVTGRAKGEGELLSGIQLGVYATLLDVAQVEFISFVKTKEPKIERVKGTRTPDSLAKTARVVQAVDEATKKGAFPFTDPTSWKCCARYCGQWHACPQGGKG